MKSEEEKKTRRVPTRMYRQNTRKYGKKQRKGV